MHWYRFGAPCAVSDGIFKRVVQRFSDGNTVEMYDHVADEWSYMSSTVYSRYNHSLVVIKSKLFVIGNPRKKCEVFDKFTNNFVVIESSPTVNARRVPLQTIGAISVGNTIAVFGRKPSTIQFYDTDKCEWYEESCEISEDILKGGCIKVPQI